jgi:hypothetical protein
MSQVPLDLWFLWAIESNDRTRTKAEIQVNRKRQRM